MKKKSKGKYKDLKRGSPVKKSDVWFVAVNIRGRSYGARRGIRESDIPKKIRDREYRGKGAFGQWIRGRIGADINVRPSRVSIKELETMPKWLKKKWKKSRGQYGW